MKSLRTLIAGALLAAFGLVTALAGPVPSGAATVNNQNFVVQLYSDFLLRDPTDAELSSAVTALDGGASRASIVNPLLSSQEFAGAWADGLWTGYMRTEPVATDLQPLVDASWPSGNFLSAELLVLGSVDYFNFKGGTNDGFVEGLYSDVLFRTGSASDISFWSSAIAGGMTRSTVARNFIRGSEGARVRVEGLSTVTCEFLEFGGLSTVSSGSYCLVLERVADATGSSFWQTELRGSGQLPAIWKSFAASLEYYNNAQP